MIIQADLWQHAGEMRAHNESQREADLERRALDRDSPEGLAQARALMAPGGPFGSPIVEEAEERTVPGPAGEIPIRVFVPPRVEAVYLSIHGGGWSVGHRQMGDVRNWELAQHANVAVVSPEYRLAPEHPFPAGNEDCEAVARWLIDHAPAEFGSGRLLVGGESAGGHLAVDTLLRLRSGNGTIAPFEGANLVYGVYDLGLTPSQRLGGDDVVGTLTTKRIEAMYERYLPGLSAEERRAPEISPLYADLRDLCPALFTVGTQDPFLDDSVFLAARWELAGNHAELAVYPQGPHGVSNAPTELGRIAKERILRFVAGLASGGVPAVAAGQAATR